VSARRLTCETYASSPAHVMRVVPLSEYRYCWSPRTSDLIFAAAKLESADANDIDIYLDGADYREDGLADAHISGHEVMLFCEVYVAIPVGLLDSGATVEASRIIVK
jgi:hypothetical protein